MLDFFKKIFRFLASIIGLLLLFVLGYNLGIPNTVPLFNLHSKVTGKPHCGDINLQSKHLPEAETSDEDEDSMGIQSTRKQRPRESYDSGPAIPKIKIDIEGGHKYLQIDGIILCSSAGKGVDINYKQENNQLIAVKNTSLTSIWGILSNLEGEHFFKTREYIINLKYVNRILRENASEEGNNYKYRVFMDNNDFFYIPKEKYTYFQEELDELIRQ